MAVTTVNIHGKAYQIKTSDGQEGHVQKLAHELNKKMFAVSEHLPNVDREYLFVLSAIMSLDEALEQQNIPEEFTQELEDYKTALKDAQNHVEALKLQLEKIDEKSIEQEKQKAINSAQKIYEDEQKRKFETQRKQYEEQITQLQTQLLENHNSLSQTEEFERYLEAMLKKQEEELTSKFTAQINEIQKNHQKEQETPQKEGVRREGNKGQESGLFVDPAIDLLNTVANRLEK